MYSVSQINNAASAFHHTSQMSRTFRGAQRKGASVVWHLILPRTNSFNQTEAVFIHLSYASLGLCLSFSDNSFSFILDSNY